MKKVYSFIVLLAVMVSCGKDDPKLSVEQYLTAATNGWYISSILVMDDGKEIDALKDPDWISETDECIWDDSYIFLADGNYSVANNTKCDPDETPIVDLGTWTLNADKTSLTIDSAGDDPVTFTKLSAGDTEVRGTLAAGDWGLSVDATFVFKKK